jgi:hypothetical protein
MNIDELQYEKERLEKRLRDVIGAELERFTIVTGVYVESVYVQMVRFGVVNEKRDKHILGDVSCKIVF